MVGIFILYNKRFPYLHLYFKRFPKDPVDLIGLENIKKYEQRKKIEAQSRAS